MAQPYGQAKSETGRCSTLVITTSRHFETPSLGVWKKWRHEVEIYVDTIGQTWKGVKLILQQARRSPSALQSTDSQTFKEAFRLTVGRARAANNGVDPIDAGLFDLLSKSLSRLQDARAQAKLGLVH